MQIRHVPAINPRYWTGITLASIFGTNLGDLYAHDSGLGLIGGLPILACLFLLIYFLEWRDRHAHDAYYWLCIIIMRTGATNIADYAAFRMHINQTFLTLGLAAMIAAFGYAATMIGRKQGPGVKDLPDTNAFYWVAMLSAGVFGTVLGDVCSHYWTNDVACVVLGALLTVTLFAGRGGIAKTLAGYWLTVAVARTAGTAIGDWLAENKHIEIGLPLATLITGIAFAGVLILWRSPKPASAVAAA